MMTRPQPPLPHEPIAPFFTLSAPAALALTIGGAPATTAITASGAGGFTSGIAVFVAGLPEGLTASLSPFSLSPGSPTTLQIAALPSAAAGNYTFTVKGVSGNLSYSVIVSMIVSARLRSLAERTPRSAADAHVGHYSEGIPRHPATWYGLQEELAR